jgi:hypothetical protein
MQLNLKKHYWIVSFWADGSSARTVVSTKAPGRPLFECLNVIFDFSPRSIFRTHQ